MTTRRTNTKPPAGSPARYLSDALDSTEPEHALAAVTALRERLDEAEHQAVFALRLHGATWQQIADATGMASRQAAQYRYERSAGLLDKLSENRGRQPRP